jgi:formate hydrogenlyase transcriptional activator
LIARAIHKLSNRACRPFIRVDGAAIPQSLIASELYGHEKRAFTGALQRRLGRFEAANGGTMFLDEIGELPMETQIALLRVMQEREFKRVGSSVSIPVDVRIIAATNRDLEAAAIPGAFRQDMFCCWCHPNGRSPKVKSSNPLSPKPKDEWARQALL